MSRKPWHSDVSLEQQIECIKESSKKPPPWLPLYQNDLLGSNRIRSMNVSEIGAYIMLLCTAWQEPDCGLPDSDSLLARYSMAGKRWSRVKESVLDCFVLCNGRWYNQRLISVRYGQVMRSQSGTKWARTRWDKPLINNKSDSKNPSPLLDSCTCSSYEDDNDLTLKDLTEESSKIAAREKNGPHKSRLSQTYVVLADEFRTLWSAQHPDARLSRDDIWQWQLDIGRMVTDDKRALSEIKECMRKVFEDEFWAPKIQSPGYLRAKWNSGKLSNLASGCENWASWLGKENGGAPSD